MNLDWKAAAVLVVGGLVAAYIIKRQVVQSTEAALEAVNPVNDENIFHSGVNAVGAKVTGNDSWSLGTAIYEWTH